MTEINIKPGNLTKYLAIAVNQRKRSLAKFIVDYGNESAPASECRTEIAELEHAINEVARTQIENAKTTHIGQQARKT